MPPPSRNRRRSSSWTGPRTMAIALGGLCAVSAAVYAPALSYYLDRARCAALPAGRPGVSDAR